MCVNVCLCVRIYRPVCACVHACVCVWANIWFRPRAPVRCKFCSLNEHFGSHSSTCFAWKTSLELCVCVCVCVCVCACACVCVCAICSLIGVSTARGRTTLTKDFHATSIQLTKNRNSVNHGHPRLTSGLSSINGRKHLDNVNV
jgi:hypothetical protein